MRTFGPNSVSSGLAVAIKLAYVFVAVWVAVAVASGVVGLLVFALFTAQLHDPPASLKFFATTWTIGVPDVFYRIAVAIGALGIMRSLTALFDSFAKNQPFAVGNAEYLRRIWVTLVVIEIVRIGAFTAARLLTTLYAAGDASPLPEGIASPIDFYRWFMIFVVLILAEVFRQGTRLREDSELTV